jgi:hypothetical protein
MCNQNCGVGCGGAAGCGSNGSARALLKEKLPQLDFIVTNHGVEINRIL